MVTSRQKNHRQSLVTNRTRAREMRRDPVSAEKLFWSCVRNRQLGGHKFRRQVPIGPYIADFVCVEQRLIVELDGPLHADRQSYDESRDAYLRAEGYEVLRFGNDAFASDITLVLKTIAHALAAPSP